MHIDATIRDVNGVGRVRVVVPPYPICWINIRPVYVSIFVGYSLCGYSAYFFHIYRYPRAMADLHQNFWGAKIIYSKFIYLILL